MQETKNATKCAHCGADTELSDTNPAGIVNLCLTHRTELDMELQAIKMKYLKPKEIKGFDPSTVITVHAKTINDLWFKLLWKILETNERGEYINAYSTGVIQKGSFEKEQARLQFPAIAFSVEFPLIENVVMLPEGSTLPAPTTAEKGQEYFEGYIIGTELAENETYTYGQRINISLWDIIEMLKDTPVTNQAVIEVAKPEDYNTCKGKDGKDDPPCLRKIQFHVIPAYQECDSEAKPSQTDDGKCPKCNGTGYVLDKQKSRLNMHLEFRSWDLYGGLPQNLLGLSKLQAFVSEEIGIPVGSLFAYSSGLHLYRYQRECAQIRTKMPAPEF